MLELEGMKQIQTGMKNKALFQVYPCCQDLSPLMYIYLCTLERRMMFSANYSYYVLLLLQLTTF